MSTNNQFMNSFFTSLAELVEPAALPQAEANRRNHRNYATVIPFTAREYDRELGEQLAAEYALGLMMGIKL